jgi:ATP-dependent DNA helicase DinG
VPNLSILSYFPFDNMREKQRSVLLEIESALKSGYKNIFLEAPTGFGKTPVAVTVARYFGSSHICTATKDLQAQYKRDFAFLFEVKGRANFPCIVKEDMGLAENCDYGPCVQDESYDCIYKTRLLDYKVIGEGTPAEQVRLDPVAEKMYVDKLRKQSKILELQWRPCHYFHQRWIGAKASHTVYNYRYFLSDIFYTGTTQKRKLLVMDEAHQIESEVGDFRSFTVHKNLLRFLPRVQMPEKNVEDVETWIEFCSTLKDKMLKFIEQATDAIERGRVAEPYTERNLIDAISKEKNLESLLFDMRSNKKNWIVSSIQRDMQNQLTRATLTPLETSGYFGDILDKGTVNLFMSATILSKEYLCKISGLKPDQVKFVQVRDSDFPVKNRPIHLMNVAWLNARSMQESMPKIVKAIDNIMTIHKNEKGIIHTTSYSQLQYIRDNLSRENASRLIETGSALGREEVLEKHYKSIKPTVVISPSMHLGVDLKDDLSRFQIITKVPYPDLTDRKVSAMKDRDQRWYTWYTVLRLAQSYGRSIRSADDFATTYILDSSIAFLLKNAQDMVPKWFMEAVRTS